MKKGFTLMELIVTIIIIGVVSLITVPIVTNIVKSSRQKAYEEVVSSIEDAAYNYSIYNSLGYTSLYRTLDVSEIQSAGYLPSEDIIDPRNKEKISGCVLYRWDDEINQYEFHYQEDCSTEGLNPAVTINVLNDNNQTWMNEHIKFELSGEYDEYKYCVGPNDCDTNKSYTGTTTLDNIGTDIYICATGYVDNMIGNKSCTKAYNVDIEAPVLVASVKTTSSTITVNATCEDSLSLVKDIRYSIDGGTYQTSNVFSGLTTGTHSLSVICRDNALNEDVETRDAVELIFPVPTIAQYSQTPENSEYAQKRVIRITYDGTGVESPIYQYSLDGSDWKTVNTTTYDVTFTNNGYLYARTLDAAENKANASTYTVENVDSTEPDASISSVSTTAVSATVTGSCSDTDSTITKTEYSKDGINWQTSNVFSGLSSASNYTFKIRCTNGSGMTSTASKAATTATVTLSLGSTSGSVTAGQTTNVTINANNNGTLTCTPANANIATCSISGNTLTIRGVSAGSTTITVKESYANKTATYSVTVNPAYACSSGSELVYDSSKGWICKSGPSVSYTGYYTVSDTCYKDVPYDCNPYNCNPYSCTEPGICEDVEPYQCDPYNCNPYSCTVPGTCEGTEPYDCNPYRCNEKTKCETYTDPNGYFTSSKDESDEPCDNCTYVECSNEGYYYDCATIISECTTTWDTCYEKCYKGVTYPCDVPSTCYETCYEKCYRPAPYPCDVPSTCYDTCYETCYSEESYDCSYEDYDSGLSYSQCYNNSKYDSCSPNYSCPGNRVFSGSGSNMVCWTTATSN